MKGFISFLIVFAGLFIFIYSSSSLISNFDLTQTIGMERVFQTGMNIKELIYESGRIGAIEGFEAYLLSSPEEFNLDNAVEAAKLGAFLRISKLNELEFEGMNAKIWCGYVNENQLRKSLEGNCDYCWEISSLECLDFIQVEIITVDEEPGLGEIYFKGEKPPFIVYFGVIGITIESEKFGIKYITYVPNSEVIYIE